MTVSAVASVSDNTADLPEFYQCLAALSDKTKEFDEVVAKVKELYSNEEQGTGAGISLLELKNHTVLQYLINLLTLMLRKVEGKDIEDVRWNTVVNRTVIERIRPLETKLQYQIDKLLRKDTQHNTALSFKPNVDDLESSEEEEGEEGAVYKAPKVAAVHYYEPELRGKRPKTDETAPKLGRGVLEDLRKEMSSAPDETSHANTNKLSKRVRDRTEFEENNFIRTNLSKAEKKKPRLQSGLNAILDFDDAEMFRSAEAEMGGKKGKMKPKGKKGKKNFKKKRH